MPADALPDNAVQVTTRAQWRTWLAKHHTRPTGVWVVTFKKAEGKRHVPYAVVVDALTIPDDLATAFRAHKGAAANFAAFPRSTKKGILEWILNAKRAGTRSARVNQTAALAARNERANQWPRK